MNQCGARHARIRHESDRHEGTWLIWPHEYHFEKTKREGKPLLDSIEKIWIQIVSALHSSENIHIVAYDDRAEQRICRLLRTRNVDLCKIDFVTFETDSFWVRDFGPSFVENASSTPIILNFGFDSWGQKADCGEILFEKDARLARVIADRLGVDSVNIVDSRGIPFVLEGGAYEYDGDGSMMLCKSSVVSNHRNEELSQAEVARILSRAFGIESENMIWLEGELDVTNEDGVHTDITDCHIDGLARFYDAETIISITREYFHGKDFEKLRIASNARGAHYRIVELPVRSENEWVYINYYVGNSALLVPVLRDINREVLRILAEFYPGRKLIPIDVTPLVKYGGAIHCITKQQPSFEKE